MLQCLIMKVRLVNGKPKYELVKLQEDGTYVHDEQSTSDSKKSNIIHRFIDVGSYSCGSVFGLGENMQHRTIISRTNVQCLLIPRHWLFKKQQNPANIWIRYILFIN